MVVFGSVYHCVLLHPPQPRRSGRRGLRSRSCGDWSSSSPSRSRGSPATSPTPSAPRRPRRPAPALRAPPPPPPPPALPQRRRRRRSRTLRGCRGRWTWMPGSRSSTSRGAPGYGNFDIILLFLDGFSFQFLGPRTNTPHLPCVHRLHYFVPMPMTTVLGAG